MRIRSIIHLGRALAFVCISGVVAHAQTNRFDFALLGGFSKGPAEPFDPSTIGYHLAGLVETRSVRLPVHLRVEGAFSDWGAGRMLALSTNATVGRFADGATSPYLLAGVGAYGASTSTLRGGWTVGAGFRLPAGGRRFVLESRVHSFRATGFLGFNRPTSEIGDYWRTVWTPISLGVVF